jgi:transcription initiation factor TFIIB
MTYKERTLCSVFEQLSSIALRNGIPHIILEEAKGLYKQASSVRVTRGDNRKAIIACSMYMACKLNNVPRNTKEIGELFGVSNSIVTRGCKLIQELIAGLEVSSSRPEDYIRRFSSKLNMDEAERVFTLEIVRRAEEHEIACEFMPTSVAAGALMMTNVERHVGLQRADIAQACYLSESTMLKCYKRLNQHKELLLTR